MARLFNGSTDQINTATSIADGTAITMAGWVYASSLPNAYQIAFSLQGGGVYLLLYVKSGGTLATYGAGTPSNVNSDPWPGGTVPTGAWTHLALSAANGGNTVGYVNGVQQLSTASGGTGPGPSLQMFMGYDYGSGGRQWNGRVADVAVWNIQLTAAEIAALAIGVRPLGIRPLALQTWLPLDGLASPEPDLAGKAINGTLTGTTVAAGPPLAPFTPRWPIVLAAAAAGVIYTLPIGRVH